MVRQKSAWAYIKEYKFNSLLLKNFCYVFILVTLPLLLVLSINYQKFSDMVDNQIVNMNEDLLQKNAAVTDNAMDGVLDTLDKMAQLNSVVEVVQRTEINGTYYSMVRQVIADVNKYVQTNELIVSANIYSDVNGMLIDDQRALHMNQIEDKGKWYSIHKQTPFIGSYVLVNHTNSIFVCQTIWSAKGQPSGLFVVNVDLGKLRALLESKEVSQEGLFFITDISGQTMYCNQKDYFKWDEAVSSEYKADIAKVAAGESQLIADHGKRIVSVAESIHKSWKYAFVTEAPNYREETGSVQRFLITSIVIGLVSSVIVSYLITYLTYRPMNQIIKVIENPQLHWSEQEASKQSNELLYIIGHILADRSEDKEITDEVSERIRSLRQAQFRALQFQIDPHFLYNTLETIKWNAVEEMGIGNKTSKMLTKVARLYRLGLENDDVIVTLKEELDFLKLYIEIVTIRFGESIKFHWDIDESLNDCNMIKMCLQPIVENAIQHGLRPKNYQGNITISAYYERDRLCISIEDDGQNMDQMEIKKLNEKLKTGAGFEESKVGLRNVNERIKLIYGKKYGVSISSSGRKGRESSDLNSDVRVVLSFPCRNFNRSEETK